MRSTLLLIPALAVTLFAGLKTASAQEGYGPPPSPYWHQRAEGALEQRGFYDGMRGADRDYGNHRRPDVNNRDEYRDPHFGSDWARHEYREGFRRGYYMRVRQIYGDGGYRY